MAGYRPPSSYATLVNALGLTSGLKLLLDAGDSTSYSSGQKWLDRSGGGYDFFLGASSGSEASDPAFTGTPGALSANEYWACDTDALFTYDSANEPWMNNLHKDGAQFTALAWVFVTNYGTSSSQCVFGTLGNSGATVGLQFQINASTGVLRLQVCNGTTLTNFVSSGSAIGLSGWHLVGLTISENGGASAGQFYLDGLPNGAAFNPTYTSPSASNATFTMQVAADGNAQRPLGLNGAARIGFLGIWEGLTLSAAQIRALYDASLVVTGVSGTGSAGTVRGKIDVAGIASAAGTGSAGTIDRTSSGIAPGVAGAGTAGTVRGQVGKPITGAAGVGVASNITLRYVNFAGVAGLGRAGTVAVASAATPSQAVGVGVANEIVVGTHAVFGGVAANGVANPLTASPKAFLVGVSGAGVSGEISVTISGGGGKKKRPDNAKPKLPLKFIEREIEVIGDDGQKKKIPLRERLAPPPPPPPLVVLPKPLPPEILAPLNLPPPRLPDLRAIEREALEALDMQDAIAALNQIPDPVSEQIMRLLEDYRDMQDIAGVLAEVD